MDILHTLSQFKKQRILIVLCFIGIFHMYAKASVLEINLISHGIQIQKKGIVKGVVTTSDGKPAAYVSVVLEGTSYGTETNINGEFSFTAPEGSYTLSTHFIGLQQQHKKIIVQDGQTVSVNFILEEDAQQLNEVVVKGQESHQFVREKSEYVAKIPLSNLENSQAYTTVTKALMDQQLSFTVTDAIKNVPGVSFYGTSAAYLSVNSSLYSQRGFTTQVQARNGISALLSTTIDADNIERIEVIKGPSATLFGNNISSYGGLINIVTKKPYDHFGGEVQYTGGGYGLSRFSADVNTPLDAENKALLRINTSYSSQNTFQDFGFSKNFDIAPSFSYRVNDRLSFLLDAQFQSGSNAGGAPFIWLFQPASYKSMVNSLLSQFIPQETLEQFMADYPNTMKEAYGTNRADELPLDYKRSFITNDILTKNNSVNFFGQMQYKLSDQWLSQTVISIGDKKTKGYVPTLELLPNFVFSLIDGISTGQPSFGTPGVVMTRSARRPDINLHTEEIQQNFTGNFKLGHIQNRFITGLDYYHYHNNSVFYRYLGQLLGIVPFDGYFDYGPATGEYPGYTNFNQSNIEAAFADNAPDNYISNVENETYSAYANDVLNITDRLIVSVGLRLDHFRNLGNYDAEKDSISGAYNQTALSPKFGVVYQLVKNKLSVFGNYQDGFTNKNGTDYEGHTFKPEHATQWEGGIKIHTPGNKISGTLSYYNIKVTDILRTDPEHPDFSLQNGTQLSKGFEADITLQPLTGMNITAGYAYNDSKYTRVSEDLDGLRPTTSGPANAINFWGAYQFQEGTFRGFGVGFGGNYSGKSYSINDHSNGQFILPSYTVLNSTLFYEKAKFRIAVKMNNLTNKHYWKGYYTISPQMLRQFVGSIAFRF